jgi:hypothetical protein
MNKEAGSKRYLGAGRARDFKAGPGETLIEVGRDVFAVGPDFFCRRCDGVGCKPCKWSGEARRAS